MLDPELSEPKDKARRRMHGGIRWAEFDPVRLSDRQAHSIRLTAILEWSAMPTAEMLPRDNELEVDPSAFFSIWFLEEQKFTLLLLEYLRRFAPEHFPTEEELAAARFSFDPAPPLDSLALHACRKHRLHQWYLCASDHHAEPVIRQIYASLAEDEARHARTYLEHMKLALMLKPAQASEAFTRIGILMMNARPDKAMHPASPHADEASYLQDIANARLSDPRWLESWLSREINFDTHWESRVEAEILGFFSALFSTPLKDVKELQKLRSLLVAPALAEPAFTGTR